MTRLVVDASVAAKWFFSEPYMEEARNLFSSRYTLLAPDLIFCEVANIAWKRVRRGELLANEAAQIVAETIRMPLTVATTQSLVAPALEYALATGRTVYDCVYLALAVDRDCRLVSADERFVNSLATTAFAKRIRHVSKLR